MSYSFSFSAGTKGTACVKVADELAAVVKGQPSHEADREAAQNTAEAFIGVLREPGDDERINVSMSGSLSWSEPNVFSGANISVNAWIGPKK